MIVTGCSNFYFELPRLDKCHIDECNMYEFILQSDFMKDIVMFRLRDFSICPIRYGFHIMLPGCMSCGDYTYYLIKDTGNNIVLNYDYPDNSEISLADKSIISSYGYALISKGRLVVTGDNCLSCEGVIGEKVKVLQTGILRYQSECNNTCEYNDNKKTYIVYGEQEKG